MNMLEYIWSSQTEKENKDAETVDCVRYHFTAMIYDTRAIEPSGSVTDKGGPTPAPHGRTHSNMSRIPFNLTYKHWKLAQVCDNKS
jgi:hypothetical protein